MQGSMFVTNDRSDGKLLVGGFYTPTPTNQVSNNKDNDGGSHPGWLGHTTYSFQRMDLKSKANTIFIMLLAITVQEVSVLIRKQQITL